RPPTSPPFPYTTLFRSIPSPADVRARSLLMVAVLLFGISPAAAQTGAWLDATLAPWNQAGAAVPTAPPPKGTAPRDPRCASSVREPETAAERDVVAAGWSLYRPARVQGRPPGLLAGAAGGGVGPPSAQP